MDRKMGPMVGQRFRYKTVIFEDGVVSIGDDGDKILISIEDMQTIIKHYIQEFKIPITQKVDKII